MEAFHNNGDGWMHEVPWAPVYRPSPEEFKDPVAYIRSIQGEASRSGVCKVIPPVHACVSAPQVLRKRGRPAGADSKKGTTPFEFSTRAQSLKARRGEAAGRVKFHPAGDFELAEYEKQAHNFQARLYGCSARLAENFVEAEFWRWHQDAKGLTLQYGDNVEGSAFSNYPADQLGRSLWNLSRLPKLRGSLLSHVLEALPGVNEPMLYVGMLFSQFCWHVEDHYLFSISFLHAGAPKTWYGVPACDAAKVEAAVEAHIFGKPAAGTEGPVDSSRAVRSLIGKTTMVSPKVLLEAGVKVVKVVHNPGEYVVTFPRAYHAGFNHGFNIAEAVNFALDSWLPFGFAAERRYCSLLLPCALSAEEILMSEARALAARLLEPGSEQEPGEAERVACWQADGCTLAAAVDTVKLLAEVQARIAADAEWAVEQGWAMCRLPDTSRVCCAACHCLPHFMCAVHDAPTGGWLCMTCARKAFAAHTLADDQKLGWLCYHRGLKELQHLSGRFVKALGGEPGVPNHDVLNGVESAVADCRDCRVSPPEALHSPSEENPQQRKSVRFTRSLTIDSAKVESAPVLATAPKRPKVEKVLSQRKDGTLTKLKPPSKPKSPTKKRVRSRGDPQNGGCPKCRHSSQGCLRCRERALSSAVTLKPLQKRLKKAQTGQLTGQPLSTAPKSSPLHERASAATRA